MQVKLVNDRRLFAGLVACTLFGAQPLAAQTFECAPSDVVDTTSVPIGERSIRVCYRVRTAADGPVFGHSLQYADAWVVQYDTLWDAGIVLETPVDVELAGVRLAPGVYGLHAVPSSFEWLIIVRPGGEALDGAAYDDDARATEVGRALVRSTTLRDRVPRMTVRGEAAGRASASLVLEWDRTQVRIPVRSATHLGNVACALRGAPERQAQRASPPDSIDFPLGGQTARVCYGRPSARDRRVFGGLAPYDDMWRTGANEPAVLHLPVPADVAGIPLAAGEYTINTIPGPRQWVVVIGSATNRWGRVTPTSGGGRSQYTDAVRSQEAGRALVASGRTASHVEQFTITAEARAGGADLLLAWERTEVRIPVRAR